jgi:hypothetical protein
MTVTPLARRDAPTDERAALRHVVSAATTARAAAAAHRAAIERARELVAEAQTKLAAARANVAAAREGHAKHIAKTVVAGGEPASSTGAIRAARAVERDCEDDLEAAKSAVLALEGDLADLESDAAVAGKAIDKVLATTMEPIALRLIEEARAHHARFLTTQAALSALGSLWNSWDEIYQQINRAGSFTDADARLSRASRQKWETALNSMRMAADSPLPDLAGD